MSSSTESRFTTNLAAIILAVVIAFTAVTSAAIAQGSGSSTRVGAAADPVDASIQISQAQFPDGTTSARVIIGRADAFPDNLAASALAAPGVILLHPAAPAGPDERVMDEIGRLIGESCTADNRGRVHLMGGTSALSAELEAAVGPCAVRIAGSGREDTAARAATEAIPEGEISRLYIARGDNPADSAAASSLISSQGGVLLLTRTNSLPAETEAFLRARSTDIQQVFVLGGEAAISQDVYIAIAEIVSADIMQRVFGPSREDTAAAIADLYPPFADDPFNSVAIVDGFSEDFWTYALPAGPHAAFQGSAPLLYARPGNDVLPDATYDAIRSRTEGDGGGNVFAYGPTTRISDGALANARNAVNGDAQTGGSTPPPAAGVAWLALRETDDGTQIVNEDGIVILAEDSEITSFDVSATGQIVYSTIPGAIFCLCSDDGEFSLLASPEDMNGLLGFGPVFTDDGRVVFTAGSADGTTADIAVVEAQGGTDIRFHTSHGMAQTVLGDHRIDMPELAVLKFDGTVDIIDLNGVNDVQDTGLSNATDVAIGGDGVLIGHNADGFTFVSKRVGDDDTVAQSAASGPLGGFTSDGRLVFIDTLSATVRWLSEAGPSGDAGTVTEGGGMTYGVDVLGTSYAAVHGAVITGGVDSTTASTTTQAEGYSLVRVDPSR